MGDLKILFFRITVLIGIYTAFRFLFFALNFTLFDPLSFEQWMNIVYGGFRFDLSAIFISNSLYILIWIIPFQITDYSIVRKASKWLFLIVNSIVLAIHSADLVFFAFNGKRIDAEIFGLLNALPTMAGSFFVDYWPVFILFVLLVFALNYLYDKFISPPISSKFSVRIGVFVVGVILVLVGIRGGVTNNRPLSLASATLHASSNNVALVTNSPYTFIQSLIHNDIEEPNYFSDSELVSSYSVERTLKNTSTDPPPNVVLIILESFSKSYISSLNEGGPGFTPYLDTLIANSRYAKNGFANGRRSSQALVALTSGIPALMKEPFMYSKLAGNRIDGVPTRLSKLGYNTAFFNGSSKSMLAWEEYLNHVGFDKYYNKDNYPYAEHDDGKWGIYDHHMFHFFNEVIDSTDAPFFYTFFSLSSHHPFLVPDSLKSRFSNEITDYFNALKYADWSIGQFFKEARTKPWFKNTVFIITADHTVNGDSFSAAHQKRAKNWFQNRVGLYSIPILFYYPSDSVGQEIEVPISQTDVSATILEIANYSGDFVNWGTPLSQIEKGNCAYQFVNGIFQIENTNHVLLFDGEKTIGLYNYRIDYPMIDNLMAKPEFKELRKNLENKLKGAIQQHHSRMSKNRLFVKSNS